MYYMCCIVAVTTRRIEQSGQPVYAVAQIVIALEGQSVKLRCLTNPSDTILTWTFNGIDLRARENYELTGFNHTLTISTARIQESGKYGCHIPGTGINDTISLLVKSGKYIQLLHQLLNFVL